MTEETLRQLEERVSRLEEEVREVKSQLKKEPEKPWWERTAGMFKGDKAFAAMVREMQKLRRADYAAAQADSEKTSRRRKRPKNQRSR
jgi:hypothetical protein